MGVGVSGGKGVVYVVPASAAFSPRSSARLGVHYDCYEWRRMVMRMVGIQLDDMTSDDMMMN